MNSESIVIDKIKWWVYKDGLGIRTAVPLCPTHDLRLRPVQDIFSSRYNFNNISRSLKCEDCENLNKIPRAYQEEKQYVLDRIDAKIFKGMKFINLDDEALPIAEGKAKNSKYFVTALLTESKVGLRLVVYAGERGNNKKTQIFVEPEIKRLAFDQNNLHPSDIFSSIEAIFEDGTKAKIEKGGE